MTGFYYTERRLERLRKRVIKVKNNKAGKIKTTLTELQHDTISSVVILASAEIEEFLELNVEKIIANSYTFWNDTGKIKTPLISFLHHCHPASNKETIDKVKQSFSLDISEVIRKSYGVFKKLIKDNNGINEDHTQRLLQVIGINPDNVNAERLVLSNFAKKRGAIAHKGFKNNEVRSYVDPSIIANDISDVILALKAIDDEINRT